MSELSTTVRTIEPFGFWPQYASALGGLGGEQGGPDPYYCFHTPYLEYRPGGLIFRMRLIGARATRGELALRVHAWRADGSIDAVLVGGMRIRLEGLEGDHEYAVRVSSLPGVIYAFFGRYTQASDLEIDDLILTAEELADEDVNTYAAIDLERSPFAPDDLGAPSHLTLVGEPSLRAPASQPCTRTQISEIDVYERVPEGLLEGRTEYARWRIAYAWQVLFTYGIAQPGAAGLLYLDDDAALRRALEQRGVLMPENALAEALGQYDFFIDMQALQGTENSAAMTQQVLRRMTALRKGGLGVFLFDARLGGRATVDPTPRSDVGWTPSEQDIQRVALRVIGHGSDVAQIVWPLDREMIDPAPFGMIVQR